MQSLFVRQATRSPFRRTLSLLRSTPSPLRSLSPSLAVSGIQASRYCTPEPSAAKSHSHSAPNLTWCGDDASEAERKLFLRLLKGRDNEKKAKLLEDALADGLEPKEWMYCILLKSLADTGGNALLEAKHLWQTLKKEKKVTLGTQAYSTMVYVWARSRDMEGATYAILEMDADSIPVSAITFHALMSHRKPHHRFVKQVMDLMAKFDVPLDTHARNELIEALARDREFREAENVYEEILLSEEGATPHTFLAMLRSRVGEDNLSEAHRCLSALSNMMATLPKDDAKPPLSSSYGNAARVLRRAYYVLIDAYEARGDAEMVEKMMREMEEEHQLAPRTKAYNSLIRAHFNNDQCEAALKTFSVMQEKNLPKDAATYPAVLDAYVQLGLLEEAQPIVAEMNQRGFKYDQEAYAPTSGDSLLPRLLHLQKE